jgi:hypothetical protein
VTSRAQHALRAYSLPALRGQNRGAEDEIPWGKFHPIDEFKSAAYKSLLIFCARLFGAQKPVAFNLFKCVHLLLLVEFLREKWNSKFRNRSHTGINNMKALSALTVISVVILTACSSKSPSESDAKEAILNQLGGCSRITLESFEKTNGIANGENQYQVAVKFSLKILPPSDVDAQQNTYTANVNEVTIKLKNLEQEVLKNQPAVPPGFPELENKIIYSGYNAQKLTSLQHEMDIAKGAPWRDLQTTCPNIGGNVNSLIGFAGNRLEASNPDKNPYLTGFTTEPIETTINLVKTDNGWKEGL